jgi:hypothetical protein
MLNRLKEQLQSLAEEGTSFDTTQFNDPLAETIEWTPAKGGGSNLRTHKLVQTGAEQAKFKITLSAQLATGVFLVTGLGVLIFGLCMFSNVFFGVPEMTGDKGPGTATFLSLLGLTFAGVGGGLMYAMSIPRVFDVHQSYYWRGRKSPDRVMNPEEIKTLIPLDTIHALQIIQERCHGNKGKTYYSYELNLVLEDGERVNVVDHGNIKKLREDAETLARLLDKPIWDATCL